MGAKSFQLFDNQHRSIPHIPIETFVQLQSSFAKPIDPNNVYRESHSTLPK